MVAARSLALAVADAPSFVGNIPYNLRPVTGIDFATMTNQVSMMETTYSTDLLTSLRNTVISKDMSLDGHPLFLEAAKESARLRDHIANCVNDNPLGLLPYVSDHRDFYRKKLGKNRETTFEVSNVGTIQPQPQIPGSWRIERAMFSQGAAVVGQGFSLNVASVQNGPTTIVFSWQRGIIEDGILRATVSDFENSVNILSEKS
jgi:hypothetical protein